ncbi:MAG: TonB-dependent receptor [Bacteroidota bacterium]
MSFQPYRKRILQMCLTSILMIWMVTLTQAQTITGKVTDKNGEPLIGVNIILESDPTFGTVTDFNGEYTLDVKEGAVLIFSYTGYDAQTITVGNDTKLDVVMADDVEILDEVVVVGYGVAKKSDVTGAVASVKVAEIQKLASVDVTRNLQGQVPGLQIVANSGAPGVGSSVRIRGTGSFQNADPLFVVDGFLTGDISNVAPNDIESIEVLKDASATAIYGSRGANGVILITTKKGSEGKTVVELNSFVGTQNAWRTLDLLNAQQYAELYIEAVAGPEGSIDAIRDPSKKEWIQEALNGTQPGTDWQDYVFKDNALVQSHNLSIRGTEGRMRYTLGGTFFDQEGTIHLTEGRRYQANFSAQMDVKTWLTIGGDIKYSNNTAVAFDESAFFGPLTTALVKDPINPVYNNVTGDWERTGLNDFSNPGKQLWLQQYNTNEWDRYVTSASAELRPIPNLKINSLITLDQRRSSFSRYTPVTTVVEGKVIGSDFLPVVSTNESIPVSSLSETENFLWVLQNSNFATYSLDLGAHSFSVMAGLESYQEEFSQNTLSIQDVPLPEVQRYISLGANIASLQGQDFASRYTLLSYFGRINYNYGNKYLLTATLRRDGSSKFPEANRWGTFPSFSMGWNAHNEPFFPSSNILTRFKVRAGWGQVGNQNPIGPYDYISLLTPGAQYAFDNQQGQQGLATTQLPASSLKWEVSEMINVGIDMGLWNDKVVVGVDYFDKETKDLLVGSLPTPIFAGATGPASNAASMTNRGLELQAEYRDKIGKLSFSVGGNMTFIDNEVTDLGAGDLILGGQENGKMGYAATRTIVGFPFASFWTLQTNGIFQNDGEIQRYIAQDIDGNPIDVFGNILTDIEVDSRGRYFGYYTDANGERVRSQARPIQRNAKPGDIRYIDQNFDGRIDENDLVYRGSSIPDFTYGGFINLNYGIFDLGLTFLGSHGNEIANVRSYWLNNSSPIESNLSVDRLNRWTGEGTTDYHPRITAGANENSLYSERYIEDGTFFRLRNIQLGVTLPESITNKLFISRARFYLSADNLFTITNYSGLDPEIGITRGDAFAPGVDYGTYPVPRTVIFGANISF